MRRARIVSASVLFAVALVVNLVAIQPAPAPVRGEPGPIGTTGPAEPETFVQADGTRLTYLGEDYTFTGMNVYNANNRVPFCSYPMDYDLLTQSFADMGPGVEVMRAWFFQDFATVDGSRSFAAFDETIRAAEAAGIKLIVTLGNHWGDCDTEGEKTADWYSSGYTQKPPNLPQSYRDFVAGVVSRYTDRPSILMWQLLNEAEIPLWTPDNQCDEAVAHPILRDWADDMSTLVKSIDPYHLLSIGTIGSGQCGAQYTDYKALHALPNVDLCEFHDYGTETMPGDQWNGLAFRIQQCGELGKPIFVGETGINPDWLDGTLEARAALFEDKLQTQFGAGVVGEVIWAWDAFDSATNTYDIGPGDPVLGVLNPAGRPSAVNDTVEIAPDGTETVLLPLANDTDPDGDVLRIRSVRQPASGSVTCDEIECRYVPESSSVWYDTFSYTADDGRGGLDDAVVELWWSLDPGEADERSEPPDSTWGQLWWPHDANYNGRAQSFTAAASGELARIDLILSQWSTTDELLPVEIRAGDDPGGTLLTTGWLRQDGLPLYDYAWVYTWQSVGFVDPVQVTAGQQYTIVLPPLEDSGSDVPALIWWGTADAYTRGTGYAHDIAHGAATPGWTVIDYASGVIDLGFRAYIQSTDPDIDGDGVDDRIDTGDGTFDDGAGTTGSVVDTAGHDVLVAPGTDGVRITVAGTGTTQATVSVCGFTLRLAPGSDVEIACGSIRVTVIAGSAEVVLGDGLTIVTVPSGVVALVDEDPDGGYLVEHLEGDAPITVTVDGVTSSVPAGGSQTVQTWQFIGFESPIEAEPVRNVVKAGQSVPLRWRLLDAAGVPMTDLASATVTVRSLACTAGVSEDQLVETASGASGLLNLGDGYYQYTWRTPKSYANSCKTLQLDIGDGVLHTALFRFTR